MSIEEKIDAEEKVNKNCKVTMCVVISVISLIFSITALTLSIVAAQGGLAKLMAPKPVVISQQYDKGRSLDKAIETKKPILVFFYTDWCGFCQKFAPTFDKITKDAKIKANFAIAYVNCEDREANGKHIDEYKIKGFPTVFVVNTDGKRIQLDNPTFFQENAVTVVRDNALEAIGKKEDK